MDYENKIKQFLSEQFPDFSTIVGSNKSTLLSCRYDGESFGNFLFSFKYKKLYFKVTRERGEYFVSFSGDGKNWVRFLFLEAFYKENIQIDFDYTLEGLARIGTLLDEEYLEKIYQTLSTKSEHDKLNLFVEENFKSF